MNTAARHTAAAVDAAASGDARKPLFTPQLLANALSQCSHRLLVQMGDGQTLTVGEVRDLTSQYAQAFTAFGVGPGTRMALLSSNRFEVLIVGNAVSMIGGCLVPLHPMGSIDDYLYVIDDASIELLIYDPGKFSGKAAELSTAAAGLRFLTFGAAQIGDDLVAKAAGFAPAPLTPLAVSGDEISRLSYSGGTTGKPKAIAGDHRMMLTTITIMLSEWEWPVPPRTLVCAPLSHSGAALFLPVLLKGGSMVVLPGFDPLEVLQAIEKYRINCTLLVPTMIYALLDHPRFAEFDLSSLQTIFYGASLMSPARLKEGIEKLGPVFFQFYGQAEAPMTVTILRRADHDIDNPERLASCGRPTAFVDVALLDHENQPVAEGEPGEICVRGPLVMKGYLNKPEQTEEALAGGWLHTGDVAIRDPDGFLRIVDRKKDMIVTGGFNVYPREVEDVISSHPAVAQVAVIGVADERWGEAVKAVVVLRKDSMVTADELIALVRTRKGPVQAPKSVDFVAAIPVTAVGKPDKKTLRAQYAALPAAAPSVVTHG